MLRRMIEVARHYAHTGQRPGWRTPIARFFDGDRPQWRAPAPATPGRYRTLALLSAGVGGDNCGDALIQDAIERLLPGHRHRVFPLLQPLDGAQLEQLNACDAAVICGTNLYQRTFACALTPEVIARIRVPLIPLGIGASSAVGDFPLMDKAGVRAVRMIHERCVVGSVRDPLSYDFVRSLGVRNVELTGCPVLFHGGSEPQLAAARPPPARFVVAIRARLLHVDERLRAKEEATLDRLCSELQPLLFVQSPYDLELAEPLRARHGVETLADAHWTARPMIDAVARADRTVGFRLHFGMLSLSHGIPTHLIATDTRVSEFCDMMTLPYLHVADYDDDALLALLRRPLVLSPEFNRRWRILRQQMQDCLERNGLVAGERVSV